MKLLVTSEGLLDFLDVFFVDVPTQRSVRFRLTQIPNNSNFDFAIYDSAGTNFGPGALIGAAYNIPITATGFYFATGLGLVLPATGNYGQYWLMVRQQEGLKARVAGAADSGRTVHQYWDIDRLLTPPGYSGWSLGGAIVSGAFPASGSVFTVGGGSESMKAGFIG